MKRFSLILLVISMMAVMVGIVSAQDNDRSRARGGIIREVLQATAAETGLEINEIVAELASDNATLADVIEANGGSVDVVVAATVASATERINQALDSGNITQEQADKLLENLDQFVIDGINGDLPIQENGRPRLAAQRPLITAVTESTGMDTRSIAQEIRDGKTLIEVIEENGSTGEDVVAAAMTIATEQINEWVANERITQERADDLLGNLEQTYTDIINGDLQFSRSNRGDRANRDRGLGILRKIAEDTGLTMQDILPQLRDGATPAEILEGAGIEVSTFVDDLLTNTEQRLADAVENGRITQEQADERLDTIRTTLTDRLNTPVNPRDDVSEA